MGWLWFLIVGALAGWLAGLLTRGGGFGLLGDLVVGIIGALVGGLLIDMLSIRAYGFLGALVMSTVGAVVLLALIRVIKKA